MNEEKKREIRTITDAIQLVNKKELIDIYDEKDTSNGQSPHRFPFRIWFRGQENATWELKPNVFREIDNKSYEETNLYLHLKARIPEYRQKCQSTFEWLCVMQHHELPTRLLDWSESILTALFFAVKDNPAENNQASKLFILNGGRLNAQARIENNGGINTTNGFDAVVRSKLVSNHTKTSFFQELEMGDELCNSKKHLLKDIQEDNTLYKKLSYPVAVFPNRIDGRMIAQSSVFTIAGGKKYHPSTKISDTERLPYPISIEECNVEAPEGKKFLLEYLIPQNCKEQIREELWLIGIHEATLFPEIDWQAKYVKNYWLI